MFLQFKKFCSPSIYEFQDPDVAHKYYKAKSYEELYKQIRGYRSQNELPEIDYLEIIVENFLCRLPQGVGSCQPRPQLKRGLIQTLKGGIALITALAYKSFVSQEVADSRSEICKDCSLNNFPNRGNFVKWSDDLAEMSVGNRKSKFHDELGTCDGCGCPLRCKTWYAGAIKLSDEEKTIMSQANPECWQVKISK